MSKSRDPHLAGGEQAVQQFLPPKKNLHCGTCVDLVQKPPAPNRGRRCKQSRGPESSLDKWSVLTRDVSENEVPSGND